MEARSVALWQQLLHVWCFILRLLWPTWRFLEVSAQMVKAACYCYIWVVSIDADLPDGWWSGVTVQGFTWITVFKIEFSWDVGFCFSCFVYSCMFLAPTSPWDGQSPVNPKNFTVQTDYEMDSAPDFMSCDTQRHMDSSGHRDQSKSP